jgi:hypothetical protein
MIEFVIDEMKWIEVKHIMTFDPTPCTLSCFYVFRLTHYGNKIIDPLHPWCDVIYEQPIIARHDQCFQWKILNKDNNWKLAIDV